MASRNEPDEGPGRLKIAGLLLVLVVCVGGMVWMLLRGRPAPSAAPAVTTDIRANVLLAKVARMQQQGQEIPKFLKDLEPNVEVRLDGWGTEMRLGIAETEKGRVYCILSAGPDRKFGTDDDVTALAH